MPATNFSGDQEDLIPVVESALTRDSIISSPRTSFDNFARNGVPQIVSQVFEMSFEMDAADTVERDRSIKKYTLDVSIDSVNIGRPVKYDAVAQQTAPMFPNEALVKDLTLAGKLLAKVTMIKRAWHANGMVTTDRATIDNILIGRIPTMVKSQLCNTYGRSDEALIQLEEDPSDLGGYFVIKGNQYIIINMESMKYNETREFTNDARKNQLCTGDIISKSGDAYENSYRSEIVLSHNLSLTLNLSVAGFKEIDIPFFLMFRALGVYSAKDIIALITYSFDASEPITKQMLNILERALINRYPDMNALFKAEFQAVGADSVNEITNQDDVLRLLSRCTKDYDIHKAKLRGASDADKLNVEQFLLSRVAFNIDQRFLPHIGLAETDRLRKAAFFGHAIRRMLLVHLGVLKPTDRDSYKNKRINDAGMSYSRVFKTQFNFMVVQKLKRQFFKDFRNNSFADVNLQALFKSAVKADEFEKALMTAIVNGDKTMTVNKMTFKNRLSSQQLHHKNKLNVITTLRSIDTPSKGNSAKSSERAIALRQVHPTGTGYICGITSADTGAKVGMSKQLSVAADITPAGSSELLKEIVREDDDLVPIDTIIADTTVISKHNLHKVFVNGDWLGCVQDFAAFLARYRGKRRTGQINIYTTVSHNILANEIHLWVDCGRLIRPLLVVYNNMREPGYTHDKFRQWITITDEHIRQLRQGVIDIDELARQGVVEFISPEEHENCYIAFEYDRFKQHTEDPLHRFTHVDIPQGNMGLVALTSVFANHNQAARIVFQTNQVKQTNSWPLKNWPFVAHKELYHQIYNEDPLVSTFAYRHIPPMGTNAIVAISIYGGFNQEDSLIVNRSSVDRGMFDAVHFTYEKVEVEQSEIVCRPDPANTSDIKSYCNYEKLVEGIIPAGTFVYDGDCLVGKVSKLQKTEMKDPNIIYTDRSMVYRQKEPAYIWKVVHAANHDDREIIKIIFKTFRSTELGCKFCLTPAHEVLTPQGWIHMDELSPLDRIAIMTEDEYIRYERPSAVHQFRHSGPIYKVETPAAECETTLEHKMYAKQDGPFQLTPARDLLGKEYQIKDADGSTSWVRPDQTRIINYDGVVYCPTVSTGIFLTRLNGKTHWTGNSSRAGQKGVTGYLYDEADMPATASGLKCDMIFNPLSLITRMTTGVVFEGMMAKLAAHTGTCPEATMFKKLDTDNIADMLESYGFSRNGTERLYNGMTGQHMDAEIFIAPIMYQCLQKYTIDTVYANSISPTDALTRQPLHGRKLGGALKAGAMETACMSVSSINFLSEKTHEHSDGIEAYVCTNCSSRNVIVNETNGAFACKNCGDLASIVKYRTSHSSQLFFNELQGMGCGTKFHARKPVFEVLQNCSQPDEYTQDASK